MDLRWWFDRAADQTESNRGAIAGAPGILGLPVARVEWRKAAHDMAMHGGRLLALWASRDERGEDLVRAAFTADSRVLVLALAVRESDDPYPGIEDLFPGASRMQRAVADLSGLRASGVDTRRWLRHSAWPERFHPLIDAVAPPAPATAALESYPFVTVAGDGVHEIPVGPIHAGIIEPGHFRFSVVGEKVLRLEERLGYVHKGIERRFADLALLDGQRLAARVSGDSAVAFSWSYCQALEGMAAVPGRRRARRRCGRLRWNSSVSQTTWAISERSATMPDSPSDWRSSPGSRSNYCAPPNKPWGSATSWTSSCPAARMSICERTRRHRSRNA